MARRITRLSLHNAQDKKEKDVFATLPPDLIGIISEHLSSKDILSFRQSCHVLRACPARVFEKRWILERPFLLFNEASMDTLKSFMQPERRPKLKCIHLSLASLVPPHGDSAGRKMEANQSGQNFGRSLRAKMRPQRTLYMHLRAKQDKLREDFETGVRNVLAEMISIFREQGANLGLKVTGLGFDPYRFYLSDDHQEGPTPWDYERLCRALEYRQPVGKSSWDTWAISYICDALYRLRDAPPELELGNIVTGLPVDVIDQQWLAPALSDKDTPFEKLTTSRLALTVQPWPDMEGIELLENLFEDCNDFAESFQSALHHAYHLQTLALTTCNEKFDSDYLASELFYCLYDDDYDDHRILPQLRHLELHGLAITIYEFGDFLHKHEKSLRSLDLQWIKHTERPTAKLMLEGPKIEVPDTPPCADLSASLLSTLRNTRPDLRISR